MMNIMPDIKLASSSLRRIYDHPNCPICGKQTSLARVEPAERGFDTRSFNCAKCGNELNLTVKLK
jgi:transposase-like protein